MAAACLYFVAFLFYGLFGSWMIDGQLFAGLNGACLSSAHCLGVAVCESHTCQCPNGYAPMGQTCVTANGEWSAPDMEPAPFFGSIALGVPPVPLPPIDLPPPPPPIVPPPPPPPPAVPTLGVGQILPFGALQLGGPQPNPPPIVRTTSVQYGPPPPVAPPLPPPAPPIPPPAPAPEAFAVPLGPPPEPPSNFAYPGESCLGDKICLGYSFCWQGKCGCPKHFVAYGSACVSSLPVPPPLPAPQSPPVPPIAPSLMQVPPPLHQPSPFIQHPNSLPPVIPHQNQNLPPIIPHQTAAVLPRIIPHQNLNGPVPLPPVIPHPVPAIPNSHPMAFVQHPSSPHLPWHIAALLPPMALNGCPSGEIMLDSACKSTSIIADFPTGVPCHAQGHCYGGSVCTHSLCMCPYGQAWKTGTCGFDANLIPPMTFARPPPPPSHLIAASPPMPPVPQWPSPPVPMKGWMPIMATQQTQQTTTLLALGSPCLESSECRVGLGYGSYCQVGICTCRPSYEKTGKYSCVLRKKVKLSNIGKASSGPFGRENNQNQKTNTRARVKIIRAQRGKLFM